MGVRWPIGGGGEMGTVFRLLILAGFVAAAAGSASVGGKRYHPKVSEAEPGIADEDIYAATIRVLADDGYEFEDKDKEAGIVTTKPVSAGMAGGLSTDTVLHSWRARIEEGTLRLEIGCGMETSNGRRYPCAGPSADERKADWVANEPRLRKRIMDEAHRRAAKRKARATQPDAGVE